MEAEGGSKRPTPNAEYPTSNGEGEGRARDGLIG
jgi:hypothetical protein